MDKITGIHIYYYKICKRKLWYFLKECCMEKENELVETGKIIDESTYQQNDKHIDILGYANIDSIHDNTIQEIKKSRSQEDASIWQIKYYLYILKKYGIDNITGELCYPTLRKKININLNENDITEIDKISKEIRNLAKSDIPILINQNMKENTKKNICQKCAYHDLCKI